MSWDFDIEANTGNEFYSVEYLGNYTYNVSPLYRKAFGMGGSLDEYIGDQRCEVLVPLLREAIADMESNPDEYKKLVKGVTWGCYEGALEMLQKILVGCEKHPSATLVVS